MKIIHKIAAVCIKDNKFLMVRKKGKDIWTNLGGKIENGETEEEALLREIKEEIDCGAEIIKKLGDFEAKAVFDDAIVRLSFYLVNLKGKIRLADDELEEVKFISKDYRKENIKLPEESMEKQVIPFLIKNGLIDW